VFEEMVLTLLRGERAQVPDNRPFAGPDGRTRPVRAGTITSEYLADSYRTASEYLAGT